MNIPNFFLVNLKEYVDDKKTIVIDFLYDERKGNAQLREHALLTNYKGDQLIAVIEDRITSTGRSFELTIPEFCTPDYWDDAIKEFRQSHDVILRELGDFINPKIQLEVSIERALIKQAVEIQSRRIPEEDETELDYQEAKYLEQRLDALIKSEKGLGLPELTKVMEGYDVFGAKYYGPAQQDYYRKTFACKVKAKLSDRAELDITLDEDDTVFGLQYENIKGKEKQFMRSLSAVLSEIANPKPLKIEDDDVNGKWSYRLTLFNPENKTMLLQNEQLLRILTKKKDKKINGFTLLMQKYILEDLLPQRRLLDYYSNLVLHIDGVKDAELEEFY